MHSCKYIQKNPSQSAAKLSTVASSSRIAAVPVNKPASKSAIPTSTSQRPPVSSKVLFDPIGRYRLVRIFLYTYLTPLLSFTQRKTYVAMSNNAMTLSFNRLSQTRPQQHINNAQPPSLLQLLDVVFHPVPSLLPTKNRSRVSHPRPKLGQYQYKLRHHVSCYHPTTILPLFSPNAPTLRLKTIPRRKTGIIHNLDNGTLSHASMQTTKKSHLSRVSLMPMTRKRSRNRATFLCGPVISVSVRKRRMMKNRKTSRDLNGKSYYTTTTTKKTRTRTILLLTSVSDGRREHW